MEILIQKKKSGLEGEEMGEISSGLTSLSFKKSYSTMLFNQVVKVRLYCLIIIGLYCLMMIIELLLLLKTQIPPQSVPPIRKLLQASYPSPSDGRQMKTTITEN